MEILAHKKCSRCGEEKPLSEFRKMKGRDWQPCLECHRAANAKWRKDNPGKMQSARSRWIEKPENQKRHQETEKKRYEKDKARIREVQKVYEGNSKEKRRSYKRKYDIDNKERHKEYSRNRRKLPGVAEILKRKVKAWAANNKERLRELNREADTRRRARLLNAKINDFTKEQWAWLKEKYDYHCAYCGTHSNHLQQDHVEPLSKGGNHTLKNIVPACPTCNRIKKDRSLDVAGMKFVIRIPV